MEEYTQKDLVIIDELKRIYELLRLQMKRKWDRDLPMEELLLDRWERAKQLGFGEGSSIYHSSYLYGDVKVGKHTWIGPFTLLDGSGTLSMGDYCSISSGVQIYTHDTVKWAVSGGKVEYEKAPVKIGNCCYIGPQSVVAKGVTIGDHSVIGACSFIDGNVPAFSIMAGTPGRIIGKVTVDSDRIGSEYFRKVR